MTKPAHLRAPVWMGRGQKREFRRLIAAREALSRPVKAAEVDALTDYIEARDRISGLQERLAEARSPKDYMALSRAINAAVTLSRALARDLGLGDANSLPTIDPKETRP